jgi:hypothetical protein
VSEDTKITEGRFYRVFTAIMTVIGVYAVVRHGGQWAYELGRLVGAN